MTTFFIALGLLIIGYVVYGRIIGKLFGVDPNRATPAVTMTDGVDYVPMKPWRIFLIQFLNIAGVGPIIGAIMGAQFGTASFLWIVFGSIFAGGVHDYLSGMISLRNKGASLPEIHGMYLGNGMKQIMRGFTVILMILVGVVFVSTPADLLMKNFTPGWNQHIWIWVILAYYLVATLLPIDKLIGRIYPIFGILLLGMAVAIFIAFIVYQPEIPEIWSGLQNRHPNAVHSPIFPMMFVSIACGAISGFHATQSTLMARCMVNERQGRPIFYGAMITEGVVALVWAAAASYFFGPDSPVDVSGMSGAAIVGVIANTWFAPVIAVITVLGVISAAVTSGDTALRSARLIIADFLHFNQKPIKNRLIVAIPVFVITAGLILYSRSGKGGFDVIWRYFAWANQVLAMVTLWAVTVFLTKENQKHLYTLIPAIFMTMVTLTYILEFPTSTYDERWGLSASWAPIVAGIITLALTIWYCIWHRKVYLSQNIKR